MTIKSLNEKNTKETTKLIWILIDHDYYPSKIIGVFPSHADALEKFEETEIPDNLGQEIVPWDIVHNKEATYINND